jgi:hypothetical protein
VHIFLVIKSLIIILLTYYISHLSHQWIVKQLSLHINFWKFSMVSLVFVGFCLTEYQIVYIILTAQKTAMPLTWQQNTLFFQHQHMSTCHTLLLQIVGFGLKHNVNAMLKIYFSSKENKHVLHK